MKANWAGNVEYSAARYSSPSSLAELQSVVASSDHVHAVGAGHSFSRIADTTGTLISLDRMPRVFSVGSTVRVDAGMRLAKLAALLDASDLALHSMPSLPHITVAGAVTTATHGSGDTCGSLASAVRSLELVTATGDVVTVSGADLAGTVVSLGGLGVIVSVSLEVLPAFQVSQQVWEGVPWETLVSDLDAVFASAYSVSAFVSWPDSVSVWAKSRVGAPPADLSWTGGRPAPGPRHPVPTQSAEHCTQQGGVPGPWHERLPHFRAEFTPSVGAELQTEYFVPRSRAAAALTALSALSP
ncbi:FAD-binding protein [Lentzea tibetensis]|uniref:FAD-binding protein n=1 Tax=Lentzea tibetensis TaxID=2591470 RepID=UPI001C99AE69|nr:FAD-binding protein [Lentzea tibetensis]